jgi:hypothetical protein
MSLTKVSFSMITGAPVNPLDYGATGTGTGDDTAGLQAAIDACPVGGLVYGNGLTYRTTGVTISDAITVEGVNLLMFQKTPAQTSQDAFTIAANGVRLVNCGAITNETALPNTTNSAGVYSVGNSNVLIDGGEWIGSISKDYTPGNWRGVIYIEGGEDCVVQNTITRDAYGEGLWFQDTLRGKALNNKAYNAGGSEVVFYSDYGLMEGNILVGNPVAGNSGAAVGGDYVTIANNEIIDASGWGITHGEGASLGGLITGNTIKGYNNDTSDPLVKAGINSQQANGLVVSNNVVLGSRPGTVAPGIAFLNGPKSFTCDGNYIEGTTGQGIYVLDGVGGVAKGSIRNNTIRNPLSWHIYVGNVLQIDISNNTLNNAYLSGTFTFFVYLEFPTATPEFIRITNNVMESSTVNYTSCILLNSTLSSSTQYIQHGNYLTNWTSAPFSSGRNCNYDVRNDNYGVSPKSGLVTLTNGGTTTTVTSIQVSAVSVIMLELANAAASTLNPVYRISTLANGSFTITHTAGTAAGEQLRWTII